jgi:hypothetical protein
MSTRRLHIDGCLRDPRATAEAERRRTARRALCALTLAGYALQESGHIDAVPRLGMIALEVARREEALDAA